MNNVENYKYTGLTNIMECLSKIIITNDIQKITQLLHKFIDDNSTQAERVECFKEINDCLTLINFTKIKTKTKNSYISDKFNKNRGYISRTNFLLENVLHVVLQCNRTNIQKWCKKNISKTTFIWPFVELKYIIKANIENGIHTIVGMEKVDMDMYDACDEKPDDMFVIYDILVQLSVILHCLQESVGFMHRDLHLGNIMLNTREQPKTVTYTLDGENIVVTNSKYEVKLIDLGQSCVDLSKCGSFCDMNTKISGKPVSSEFVNNLVVKCENKAQDLRFLCAHICMRYSFKIKTPGSNRFFDCLSTATFKGIKKAINQNINNFHQPGVVMHPHNVYTAIHKNVVRYVPAFEPINFFRSMKKWENDFAGK